MKLATIKDGTRDGRLAVVSRDLKTAAWADGIAPTLQQALDDWRGTAPRLEELAAALESGHAARAFAFDPAAALSPLPRAHHWVDGSAYVNHVELVRKARGAEMPESFWTDPLIYRNPRHPYTEALLSAIPVPDPTRKSRRIVLAGDVPSPMNPPPGCPFHKRCPRAMEVCSREVPPVVDVGSADSPHHVACHLHA